MKINFHKPRIFGRTLGLALLAVAAGLLPGKVAAQGHFVATATPAPSYSGNLGHMLLLPDGRVMIQEKFGSGWQFYLPDNQGHYVNGSWASCPSMHDTREYYASAMLTDGRVFVAGGEDGTGGATAEIFDPQANGGAGSWTRINPPVSLLNPAVQSPALASTDSNPNQQFSDCESVILPDGNVLVSPVGPNVQGGTLIYNPVANTWTAGPKSGSIYQDECSWVKLPDDSILTIDPSSSSTERYIPALNKWITDQSTPSYMWSSKQEIGTAMLLDTGVVWCLGGNGVTAYYTPSGGTNQGNWTPGPNIPAGLVMRDAPGVMLANGKVLLTFVPTTGDSPMTMYEFDQNGGSPAQVFTDNANISDQTSMLELPDGTVLFNDTTNVYVYQPSGSPLPAGKPNIQSVTWNTDGASLRVTGTLFNGLNQGAMYGDDAQQDSNYPLASFTSGSGVYYGRTFNWSSTSVATGGKVVSTEVVLPSAVIENPGNYSLRIIANGNASAPVSFYGPVWVNFTYTGSSQTGAFAAPYKTLAGGVARVASGGTIALYDYVQPSVSHETLTISKPMTIIAIDGPATIGH